jgi:hypothetical protein
VPQLVATKSALLLHPSDQLVYATAKSLELTQGVLGSLAKPNAVQLEPTPPRLGSQLVIADLTEVQGCSPSLGVGLELEDAAVGHQASPEVG